MPRPTDPTLPTPAGRVLATAGPEASPAALLADSLGWPLRIEDRDIVAVARAEIRTAADFLIVVTARERARDPLLFGLLDEVEAFLASDLPWDRLPRFSLVTGRSLFSLSGLVARIIARRSEPARSSARRLAHFGAGTDLTLLTEVEIEPSSEIRSLRRELGAAALGASLGEPRQAIAYQTHGFDACAKGGAGVVLCGLAGTPRIEEAQTGILCCAHGHPCPRGPHPFSLRDVSSEILLLATCNGLRLGDSALTADFNLGLSFLEGGGLGYAGTVFSAPGSDLCSLVFLAALAAGCTLAEATGFLNALLFCAGIERTAYATLGMPDLTAVDGAAAAGRRRTVSWPGAAEPLACDFENAHVGEIVIEDPGLVQRARESRLGLSIAASTPGEAIHWFYRAEKGSVARAFLFRFPEPLGRLALTSCDPAGLAGEAGAALRGLGRWLELWRLSGLKAREAETFRQLEEISLEIRESLARQLPRLRFDGAAAGLLERQVQMIDQVSGVAREAVIAELLPRMTGPFWITNLLAMEYGYEGSRPARCPHCATPAVGKRVGHPLHREMRQVDICPGCGIVSDLLEDGDLASVVVQAPALAAVGERVPVRVEIRPRAGRRALAAAHLRLSTHGLREVVPSPPRVERNLGEEGESFLFHLEVPSDLPPHQYFLKVMVATDRELAFASRLLFVTLQ